MYSINKCFFKKKGMKGAAAHTNNRFNLMTLVASYPERWAKKQLYFVGLFINFVFHFAGAMEQLTGSRS